MLPAPALCKKSAPGSPSGPGVAGTMAQDKGVASILVVDDDHAIRTLLASFLETHGFAVETARDGIEMQRRLEQGRHDLAILDLMLPGQDGLELCRLLRQRGAMPIIMLTARAEETDRIVGLEIGRMTMSRSPSTRANCSRAFGRCCAAAAGRPNLNCRRAAIASRAGCSRSNGANSPIRPG